MTPVAAEASLAFSGEGAKEVTASMTTKAAAKPKEATTCATPPSTSSATTIKPPPPPKPSPSSRHARLVVLAGPCGSGKTTVGRALSALLGGAGTSSAAALAPAALAPGVPFLDADDYHDAAAIRKMSEGRPLDDGDRLPWLARVAAASRDAAAFSPSHVAVLACSALKKKYRELLEEVANEGAAVPTVHVDFVLLRARRESLRARLQERQERLQRTSGAAEEVAGHFLHPSLLESQLEAWEDSEEVVVVENDGEGAGGEGGGGGGAEAAAAARTAEAVLLAVGLADGGGGKQ